jgi:hypothetical protein
MEVVLVLENVGVKGLRSHRLISTIYLRDNVFIDMNLMKLTEY